MVIYSRSCPGEIEDRVISGIKSLIPQIVQDKFHTFRMAFRRWEKKQTGDDIISDGVEMAGWGVEEASQRYKAEASKCTKSHLETKTRNEQGILTVYGQLLGLGTQLALTYAIHKSFIFVRIPLTVGITPKVVRVLRGWGWQIGKRQKPGRRR